MLTSYSKQGGNIQDATNASEGQNPMHSMNPENMHWRSLARACWVSVCVNEVCFMLEK